MMITVFALMGLYLMISSHHVTSMFYSSVRKIPMSSLSHDASTDVFQKVHGMGPPSGPS